MNERKMERILMELMEGIADDEDLQASLDLPALANARVKTFADAHLLTRESGIVLALADGSEFQIAVAGGDGEDGED